MEALFINIGSARRKVSNIKPPLLMQYAATMLHEQGLRVKLIDAVVDKLSVPEIAGYLQGKKDVFIVISAHISRFKDYIRVASQLKNALSASTIIGVGPCATSLYDKFTSSDSPIDYILRGEYDTALLKLIRSLLSGPKAGSLEAIGSLCLKNTSRQAVVENVADLDELPIINHELFGNIDKYRNIYPLKLNKKLRWGFIITSRGCPNQCSFCSSEIRVTYGSRYRTRGPENVLKEVKLLIGSGANVIDFIDDNFTCRRQHVIDVCDMLMKEKIQVPWICHARVDEVDEALLKKMKAAGCILIRFGVESGSIKVLKRINKFSGDKDWAGLTKKALSLTSSVGIDSVVMYILGSPTENKADIKQTKQLIKDTEATLLQLDFYCLYPDSFEFQQLKGRPGFHQDNLLKQDEEPPGLSKVSWPQVSSVYSIYFSFYLAPRRLAGFIRDYYKFYLYNPHILASYFRGVFASFREIPRKAFKLYQ